MIKLAVIRIRGQIGLSRKVKDTLKMIHLFKRNSCVILDANPSYLGMLNTAKDYITWGELNETIFNTLLKNRGKLPGNQTITEDYVKKKLGISMD